MSSASAFCVLLAAVSTGVLFNIPRRALWVIPPVALTGAVLAAEGAAHGWTAPQYLFAASLVVALLGEWLARLLRLPAPVLAVPAVIPLVPGSLAYAAMAAAVAGEIALAAEQAALALFSAGGIASGLLLATALFRKPRAHGRGLAA